MVTNHKKRGEATQSPSYQAEQANVQQESCQCLPLSILHNQLQKEEAEDIQEQESIVPATLDLKRRLESKLDELLIYTQPVSVLILHISQWERFPITFQPTLLKKRKRYHAPEGLLEQVLANVRRVIRADDQLLIQEESGTAILLPGVDKQGIQSILERVYRSISLLQAETVIPPLTRDTTVILGVGSYPGSGEGMEQFFYHLGLTARRFTLRPALGTQLWDLRGRGEAGAEKEAKRRTKRGSAEGGQVGIPFMQLPEELPSRLKNLIPYNVAQEITCAPVGRDHHSLTVAMLDPTNQASIQRLHQLTGMTIFPVACEPEGLKALLAKKW